MMNTTATTTPTAIAGKPAATRRPPPRRLPRPRTAQQIADDIDFALDEHGHPVAHVRTPSGRVVKIDADALERLIDEGWSPALRLSCPSGRAVYVTTRKLGGKGSDVIVARLVTKAAPDEVVVYLNGRYDLRKRSLVVKKSCRKVAADAAREAKSAAKIAAE